jgi:RNA polymerase sigma factor (sigma-70 family)
MRENDMASAQQGAALRHINRLFGEGTVAGLSDARLLERYVSERDDLAFQALVQRHGPMVMAVCRCLLDDPNDADDAFQAAFLLLARKARSIWINGSVGGWLHRVAWRIALQVKSDAARRRRQERRAAELAGARTAFGPAWDDAAMVLHQEIDRLPERYRKPIILCYLEDMTYQQAARSLHWSEGTTRGRLARGKELLRNRLTRRGVTLAVVALGAGSAARAGSAVPAGLLQSTTLAAHYTALGETAAAGTISTSAATLIERALRTMMIARLKMAAMAALFVAAVTCVATGLSATWPATPDVTFAAPPGIAQDRPSAERPAGQGKIAAETGLVAIHGRVLGPEGKPAAGAGLYTVRLDPTQERAEPVLRARADTDGTFRFTLPRAELDEAVGRSPWATFTILAASEGLGPDWVELRQPPHEDLSLRLVDDSVPITGRILDLQGRPVAGARITRGRIEVEGAGGIDPYLKLVREDPFQASNHNFAKNYWAGRLPGQPISVTTDAEGRFHLTGIGRDRIVELEVEGPTIQSATITVMTRATGPVSSPRDAFAAKTIYGASFDHLIPPGRALAGVVRDKRTRQPLAGINVSGQETNARVTTDANGRFALPGFPKGKHYGLMVGAGYKPPYFVTCASVPDTAGMAPIQVDVECVPGILLRLKLIDKETGKPVTGADVYYQPIYPNPHVREAAGYAPVNGIGPYNEGIQQADGTYLLGVLPGPGGVFVRTAEGRYRPACVDPRAFFKVEQAKDAGQRQDWLYGDLNTIFTAAGQGQGATPQEQFSAIVLVNPAEDAGPLTAEAVLERDPKREVRVLGPDGEPLSGVTSEDKGAETTRTPGVMTVSRLNPLRPRRFTFRHGARKLVGSLIARGDESEPYTVKLQP